MGNHAICEALEQSSTNSTVKFRNAEAFGIDAHQMPLFQYHHFRQTVALIYCTFCSGSITAFKDCQGLLMPSYTSKGLL